MFSITVIVLATKPAFADSVDFVKEVRPIFEKHCYSCHGEKRQRSGFRLDVKEAAFNSGDGYGPNIIRGKAKQSPLMKFVRGQDKDILMPPKGDRLSKAELETLARWIDEGTAADISHQRIQPCPTHTYTPSTSNSVGTLPTTPGNSTFRGKSPLQSCLESYFSPTSRRWARRGCGCTARTYC